jgi:hypothetical protein
VLDHAPALWFLLIGIASMLPDKPVELKEKNTSWPALPTETEIYLLPDGRVVIADLPAELASLIEQLGRLLQETMPSEAGETDV